MRVPQKHRSSGIPPSALSSSRSSVMSSSPKFQLPPICWGYPDLYQYFKIQSFLLRFILVISMCLEGGLFTWTSHGCFKLSTAKADRHFFPLILLSSVTLRQWRHHLFRHPNLGLSFLSSPLLLPPSWYTSMYCNSLREGFLMCQSTYYTFLKNTDLRIWSLPYSNPWINSHCFQNKFKLVMLLKAQSTFQSETDWAQLKCHLMNLLWSVCN